MSAAVPRHPGASSPEVSARMSAFPRRDTKPEIEFRRLLHASGRRYRVHYPVPGLPRRTMDVAFTRARLAIFIDGCFWHGCPEHGSLPASNADWWRVKIDVTRARDVETTTVLRSLDWDVLRLWEHESPEAMVRLAATRLGSRP